METDIISCHPRKLKAKWVPNRYELLVCSACESLHPDLFITSIQEGSFYSGWHWDKNEPSYCELSNGRFYMTHLADMPRAWLYEHAVEIFRLTGVLLYWDREWLRYHAVADGAYFGIDSAMKVTTEQINQARKANDKHYKKHL